MATTYILKCFDNSYYIGSTTSVQRRLVEHSKGKCLYTKSRLPIQLVFTQEFQTLSKAKKREYQIKRWKSRKAIERLIKYSLLGPIV